MPELHRLNELVLIRLGVVAAAAIAVTWGEATICSSNETLLLEFTLDPLHPFPPAATAAAAAALNNGFRLIMLGWVEPSWALTF